MKKTINLIALFKSLRYKSVILKKAKGRQPNTRLPARLPWRLLHLGFGAGFSQLLEDAFCF
jgi:hypothetical protein